MIDMFSPKSIETLGYYVYSLKDPRNNKVFYIGKGKGNRVFEHEACSTNIIDNEEVMKIKTINEIRNEGKTVIKHIIRYGLTEDEAFHVESALIDFIGLNELTNMVKGHHSSRMYTVEEFESIFAAEKVEIEDEVILVRVNRSYYRGISKKELYDRTRFCWKLSGYRIKNIKYALATYNGLVKEVYQINEWKIVNINKTKHPYGNFIPQDEGRKYFEGVIAPDDIRNKYLNNNVSDYLNKSQNPIIYVNC